MGGKFAWQRIKRCTIYKIRRKIPVLQIFPFLFYIFHEIIAALFLMHKYAVR